MLGVLSVEDALARARQTGLDLVEVSPNSSPPVCKILDYGKFKYEAQKRANQARKKQKTFDVKETAKVEQVPRLEGRQMTMVVAPR